MTISTRRGRENRGLKAASAVLLGLLAAPEVAMAKTAAPDARREPILSAWTSWQEAGTETSEGADSSASAEDLKEAFLQRFEEVEPTALSGLGLPNALLAAGLRQLGERNVYERPEIAVKQLWHYLGVESDEAGKAIVRTYVLPLAILGAHPAPKALEELAWLYEYSSPDQREIIGLRLADAESAAGHPRRAKRILRRVVKADPERLDPSFLAGWLATSARAKLDHLGVQRDWFESAEWVSGERARQSKLTVIDVWAPWCAPCLKTMPGLNKVHQDYAAKGVSFIGVTHSEVGRSDDAESTSEEASEGSVGDTQGPEVERIWSELGLTYDSAMVPRQLLREDWGVSSYPLLLVLDEKGKVVFAESGSGSDRILPWILDKLLDDA